MPGTVNYPTALDTIVDLFESKNSATGTLGAQLLAGATTEAQLLDTSSFPDSGVVSIDNEVIYYTSKSDVTDKLLGLTRGADGTVDATHANGSVVEGRIVSRHVTVLRDAIMAVQSRLGINYAKASLPTAGSNGRLARVTDDIRGIWMDIGDQWIPLNNGYVNAKEFGAVGDAKAVGGAAITAGTDDLTLTTGQFSAADQGKTIVIPGAGPAGVALVTTILTYVSATAVTLATNASTTVTSGSGSCLWGTDDTTALQDALDTGARVMLPFSAGAYLISDTLDIGNGSSSANSTMNSCGIMGVGNSAGSAAVPGWPTIVWAGASGGTMLRVNGPIQDVRIDSLALNCSGIAARGIDWLHTQESRYTNISINSATGYGANLTAYPTPAGTTNGANNNLFENVYILSTLNNCGGFTIGENTTGGGLDPAQNLFSNCKAILTGTGTTGIRIQFSDATTWLNCMVNASLGLSVVVPGGVSGDQYPDTHVFYNTPLVGGVSITGTWNALHKFIFWPYPTGDGAPVPNHKNMIGLNSNGSIFGFITGFPLKYSCISQSSAIANTVTETAFDKTFSLPADSLSLVGSVLRIKAAGRYSTTGAPSIIFRARINGVTISDPIMGTATGASNFQWSFESEMTVRSTGVSGSMQRGVSFAGTGGGSVGCGASAGTFTLDTTAAKTIDITVQWGTASPSNTIILDSLTVDVVYPTSTS